MTGPTATDPTPTEPAPPTASSTVIRPEHRRGLASAFTISGVVTIAFAIVLGIAVDPLLYLVALVGIADFVIARLFASGRLGGRGTPADAAAAAAADPSYNPYARED